MATVLFSVAGAAIGGTVGGSVAGLATATIGRAVGATLGRVIDQRLLGQGGQAIETGKVDRFRVTGAGEGDPIAQTYGRMRLGGHVIWASDFLESTETTGGGKGTRSQPKTTEYSYTVSLAIGICEGVITRVGRVWADGEEVATDDLNMRVYYGSEDQLPDPVIEAVEGAGRVPAYRGTAYVVMENLRLAPFGNRIPQFSFEVLRPEQPGVEGAEHTLAYGVSGVALIPGTGEYTIATSPVNYLIEDGAYESANISTPAAKPDFTAATEAMLEELPNLEAVSLVISWFGDDLRCEDCSIRPKVENRYFEAEDKPWVVSGLKRENAQDIVQDGGRPVYGGTPADFSVIEAIHSLRNAGKAVMFYPFILMDPYTGNTRADPYSDNTFQPNLPWRGRITLSKAPGRPATTDGTASADIEIDAFFGYATAGDFSIEDGQVVFGPDLVEPEEPEEGEEEETENIGPTYDDRRENWTFSRFILHYAILCREAGGVESFCIGTEMRGMTQARGSGGSFRFVQHLRTLAAEVRGILGPATKITYAADWSEYFGYVPPDGSGDRYFNLDPLWADANIDFIGIDNYMPLSDWRQNEEHLDAQVWGSEYDLDYLKGNIQGGEGYDWYYASQAARDAQNRTPITDSAYGEPWVHRYKDLRGWWQNAHFDRIGGVRSSTATAWVPQSKPIWFTEYGCAAVNKGTNEPNKFLDFKSSEGRLPVYSNGARDELIQLQYLRAMSEYWKAPANNPISSEYGNRMLNMNRAFVWALDTRPYPFFPNNLEKWSDGENYTRGHWINGRTAGRSLASVVSEICRRAGVEALDVDQLYGYVRGYSVQEVTDARAALQPLMLRFGFDAIERDGMLKFQMRAGRQPVVLDPDGFAVTSELDGVKEQTREGEAEASGRMRLRFVQADADFDVISEETVMPDEATHSVSGTEINIALTRGEGRQIVERWLTEARVSRDSVRFALPPSQLALGAGDVVELAADGLEQPARFRIDRVDQSDVQLIEAVRIDPKVYDLADIFDEIVPPKRFVAPVPVVSHFLDLPLLRGDEVPHAPYIAAAAQPWPGPVALYQSSTDQNYTLNTIAENRSTLGSTQTSLRSARSAVIDRGASLDIKLISGNLSSVNDEALLTGANMAAVGDGSVDNWEVFQFRDAELVAPLTYRLRHLLRGQAGSDGLMPELWPTGSRFVLLNAIPKQIEQSPNLRGVSQSFRIGPAHRGFDDPSYRVVPGAFAGNGLRPLAPAHLKSSKTAQGGHLFTWVRRTRQGGDAWDAPEVPLSEENEAYLVQVYQAGALVRETVRATPDWEYTTAMQTDDALIGPFEMRVAQVSAVYGPGIYRRATVLS
ncbi:MAG: glycoside hydrolase TIM-barrel-like domain-containing protein [Pseudomonadota bacterium]